MATTGTMFEAMINYYSSVSRQALNAMYETREDLRTGKFRVNRAFGRAVSVWLEAADGWWNAVLAGASAPLPTIFLDVHAVDSTAVRSVNLVVPPGPDPEVTVIGQIGGTHEFPNGPGHLEIEVTNRRDAIEVKLKNLKALRQGRNKVPAGLYGGIIHLKEKPLAFLMIQMR